MKRRREMPRRQLRFAAANYYHIYNRGLNGEPIFFEHDNYFYLLRLIEKAFEKHNVTTIVYCLLPNHYHFLLRTEIDDVLSDCIKEIFISYVQAVNKRYKRSGPLFEGRFRSKWIDDIDYLLHLCRYIHLNPVRAGLVKSPEDWIFSNYRDFVGLRNNGLIDRKFIKKYFTTANDYCNFIAENVTSRNP
jgi:REP element-mobilizing transposase RayT